MEPTARRIEYLRSKLEELAGRKQRMTVMLSDGSLTGKSHNLWTKRLEWVIEDIRKRSAALAELEKDLPKTTEGTSPAVSKQFDQRSAEA